MLIHVSHLQTLALLDAAPFTGVERTRMGGPLPDTLKLAFRV